MRARRGRGRAAVGSLTIMGSRKNLASILIDIVRHRKQLQCPALSRVLIGATDPYPELLRAALQDAVKRSLYEYIPAFMSSHHWGRTGGVGTFCRGQFPQHVAAIKGLRSLEKDQMKDQLEGYLLTDLRVGKATETVGTMLEATAEEREQEQQMWEMIERQAFSGTSAR